MMRKYAAIFLMLLCLLLCACSSENLPEAYPSALVPSETHTETDDPYEDDSTSVVLSGEEETKQAAENTSTILPTFDLNSVPPYSGSPYTVINGNTPNFTQVYPPDCFETYSNLDSQGRCGAAMACIGTAMIPTEERGAIGSIKPTGWHTVKYNGIDGNYLYNRCHLIGYQLSGENANERNLITGTRYLNVEGMLPFENQVHDFVTETGIHVLYRVTPIFDGDNLLASGVLMEAKSVEDNGTGLQFYVYVYNVQPGISIHYEDGSSSGPEFTGTTSSDTSSSPTATAVSPGMGEDKDLSSETTYVCNTNTKKFHLPNCGSVKQMASKNLREETCGKQDLISRGYEPCKNCCP